MGTPEFVAKPCRGHNTSCSFSDLDGGESVAGKGPGTTHVKHVTTSSPHGRRGSTKAAGERSTANLNTESTNLGGDRVPRLTCPFAQKPSRTGGAPHDEGATHAKAALIPCLHKKSQRRHAHGDDRYGMRPLNDCTSARAPVLNVYVGRVSGRFDNWTWIGSVWSRFLLVEKGEHKRNVRIFVVPKSAMVQ